MPFREYPNYLLICQAAAAAFAAARLLHFHLWRRFPFLYSYLVSKSIYDALLSVIADGSGIYLRIYLFGSTLFCLLGALAVYEMFSLIFRDYPGLRTAGRWALSGALVISLMAAAMMTGPPFPGETPLTQVLFYDISLDRSVHLSLAVVVIILMVFLSRYPLRLDRNVYVASSFFSATFVVQAIARLVDLTSPRLYTRYVDHPETVIAAICFLGWGIMLDRAMEPLPKRAPAEPGRETELLRQLESMNSILIRSVRR